MSDKIKFTLDGVEIEAVKGQSILEAAEKAGVYIPRLCNYKGLTAHGSCRVCTVKVNGRSQSACTQPAADGIVVQNDTEELKKFRADLIEMLFVEGNHYCMFCEKSGKCELQALAYRFGISAPKHDFLFPDRDVDASHKSVLIDRNRCILCGRCVRASKEMDNKNVFQFAGRSTHKHVAVNADKNLSDTDLKVVDKAVSVCPVGAIIAKKVGFETPVGQRIYDSKPIGSDVEAGRLNTNELGENNE